MTSQYAQPATRNRAIARTLNRIAELEHRLSTEPVKAERGPISRDIDEERDILDKLRSCK